MRDMKPELDCAMKRKRDVTDNLLNFLHAKSLCTGKAGSHLLPGSVPLANRSMYMEPIQDGECLNTTPDDNKQSLLKYQVVNSKNSQSTCTDKNRKSLHIITYSPDMMCPVQDCWDVRYRSETLFFNHWKAAHTPNNLCRLCGMTLSVGLFATYKGQCEQHFRDKHADITIDAQNYESFVILRTYMDPGYFRYYSPNALKESGNTSVSDDQQQTKAMSSFADYKYSVKFTENMCCPVSFCSLVKYSNTDSFINHWKAAHTKNHMCRLCGFRSHSEKSVFMQHFTAKHSGMDNNNLDMDRLVVMCSYLDPKPYYYELVKETSLNIKETPLNFCKKVIDTSNENDIECITSNMKRKNIYTETGSCGDDDDDSSDENEDEDENDESHGNIVHGTSSITDDDDTVAQTADGCVVFEYGMKCPIADCPIELTYTSKEQFRTHWLYVHVPRIASCFCKRCNQYILMKSSNGIYNKQAIMLHYISKHLHMKWLPPSNRNKASCWVYEQCGGSMSEFLSIEWKYRVSHKKLYPVSVQKY